MSDNFAHFPAYVLLTRQLFTDIVANEQEVLAKLTAGTGRLFVTMLDARQMSWQDLPTGAFAGLAWGFCLHTGDGVELSLLLLKALCFRHIRCGHATPTRITPYPPAFTE